MNAWHELEPWLAASLNGMAEPWIIGCALALTTLLLEDLAIAVAAALAAQGTISWEFGFFAVGSGIAAGDLLLYGIGASARRVEWLKRKYIDGRGDWARNQINSRLGSAVLLARVIPGLRLLTYTASGFLRVNFGRFAAWVLLAVALWTAGLLWISATVGHALSLTFGLPPAVAVALPIAAVAIAFPCIRYLHNLLKRRPT